MKHRFSPGRGNEDGLGRDPVLADALASLDPASGDPNYWLRFRGWVMSGAARELARRRLMAELTVSDVLTSWGRTVVPTALLAAALAGIALLRAGEIPAQQPLSVEMLVVDEIPNEVVQTASPAGVAVLTVAADEF